MMKINRIVNGFFSSESDAIACKCCGEVMIHDAWLRHFIMLNEFRVWYSRPMIIISGYRCRSHNTHVGGASSSRHMMGDGTDIKHGEEYLNATPERKAIMEKHIEEKWFYFCDKYNAAGGVGFYKGFFHLDSRPTGRARWRG